MAGFLMGLAPLAGRLLSSGSLLKSAYGGGGMGLVNLGMDVIPLAMDIANNDVGLKSFSSFGGTLVGTKLGGRELNKLGNSTYKNLERNAVDSYNYQARADKPQMGLPSGNPNTQYGSTGNNFTKLNPNRDVWIDSNLSMARDKMINDDRYSKRGYNVAAGFGADAGLYSLTSGMGKPKPNELDASMMQGQSPSPVTRYMQMTGGL